MQWRAVANLCTAQNAKVVYSMAVHVTAPSYFTDMPLCFTLATQLSAESSSSSSESSASEHTGEHAASSEHAASTASDSTAATETATALKTRSDTPRPLGTVPGRASSSFVAAAARAVSGRIRVPLHEVLPQQLHMRRAAQQ
jgi:hypothetical protein